MCASWLSSTLPKAQFSRAGRRRRRSVGAGLLLLACACLSAFAPGAAAARPAASEFDLVANLRAPAATGSASVGEVNVGVRVAMRRICVGTSLSDVSKGRLLLERRRAAGRPARTIRLLPRKHSLKDHCIRVSRALAKELADHPGRFSVALTDSFRSDATIAARGRLRREPAHAPGAIYGHPTSQCTLLVYDDTGLLFGPDGERIPPNGTGQLTVYLYAATEGILPGSKCEAKTETTYRPFGNDVGGYAAQIKNPVVGKNSYSCTTSGEIKCFGPMEGSVLKGWNLRVIYYVCVPGAFPTDPYYCPS